LQLAKPFQLLNNLKNMRLNLSIDLAIVISIITVFLFANGNAYLGGYLHTFNVTPFTLNYSVQDKIYIGYLKGFNYLIYFIFILCGYIIVRYVLLSIDLPRSFNNYLDKKLNKSRITHKLSVHNSTFYEELDNSYAKNTFLAIVVLILLISTLLLLANTEKSARATAIEELANFDFNQITLKSTGNNSELFLIQCGINLCAVIDKDKQVTLQDPKNIVFLPNKK